MTSERQHAITEAAVQPDIGSAANGGEVSSEGVSHISESDTLAVRAMVDALVLQKIASN